MSDPKGPDKGERIELRSSASKLELKNTGDQATVRQSFSHGRSKSVAVEVKRRRTPAKPGGVAGKPGEGTTPGGAAGGRRRGQTSGGRGDKAGSKRQLADRKLTDDERKVRLRALSEAKRAQEEARQRQEENARLAAEEAQRRKDEELRQQEEGRKRLEAEEEKRQAEINAQKEKERAEAEAKKAQEEEQRRVEEEKRRKAEEKEKAASEFSDAAAENKAPAGPAASKGDAGTPGSADDRQAADKKRARSKRSEQTPKPAVDIAALEAKAEAGQAGRKNDNQKRSGRALLLEEEEELRSRGKNARAAPKRQDRDQRRSGKIILDEEEVERTPSLAKLRRQRERARQAKSVNEPKVREVIIPDHITVQELAARMAVRGAEVIKSLMRNGVMVTINQSIEGDVAEIVVTEFGHTPKRVSESDVEFGIEGAEDKEGDLVPRAPVVTVMGHVDHGKTSLLDALRKSDVAAGEAGGITQHVGAYQVNIGHGMPVAFIDTPGHEAFTSMRARGAAVTDIVVLVVAADDGVMPQTIEAIKHSKAAEVPLVVAINKIDRPEGDANRVKQELLSHEVVIEEFGGDVQCVEVSAIKKLNLDKLIEAIQLQAELLELKSNPNREGHGVIIEARLDRGRGVVATCLVQRGTLTVGDIVIAGANWGRVRALVNDKGSQVKTAGPSTPVEILGLDGVPDAGDPLTAVQSEKQAREIVDYRLRKKREQQQTAIGGPKVTMENMFLQMREGEIKELPVVIKSDVHGSMEAIAAGLDKIATDEARIRTLYAGVGGITESDVTLANASNAIMIGFNVRANAQAREMARREGVEIRYYSIIYELLDEVKLALSGLLAPEEKEVILGHAEIREVFSISKIGKIAGCMVIDGMFKRNARCRLLRNDTVIFEGALASLRRFKEDAREVREGFECGMSIENYNDIREGDVIEAYEVEEIARSL